LDSPISLDIDKRREIGGYLNTPVVIYVLFIRGKYDFNLLQSARKWLFLRDLLQKVATIPMEFI
jgi:hypothetical protein